ncbi:ATP-binding cassette domain-containing protein, partial [Anaerofustis stercorihominis]
SDSFTKLSEKEVRRHLSRCGVNFKHSNQKISSLSGGEQAKIKMCLLTLSPCNFLIMDEPTNHLDKNAKEALKKALRLFRGSVILVSHEEEFYKDFCDRVIHL